MEKSLTKKSKENTIQQNGFLINKFINRTGIHTEIVQTVFIICILYN